MKLHVGAYDHDDHLLDEVRRESRPRVKVYGLDRTVVVLGRGSKLDQEVKVEACLADRVAVLRRRGGGCAVVIDPGNLIVSAVLPAGGLGDSGRDIRALCDWLAAGLCDVGAVGVSRRGISDLVQGDRKIGGSCIYRARDVLYFSATVLACADLRLVDRYLGHPPREPAYRRSRSHGSFLATLAPRVGTAEGLARSLAEALPGPPTPT